MTIALGILCSDGIVLGVDLQYTTDIIKTAGQKLFVLKPSYDARSGYAVLVAGAGNADTIRKCVEVMDETLAETFHGRCPAYIELKYSLESALARVFHQHVDSAPVEERHGLHCDVLVAVRVGQECHLLRSNRTMLVEERQACVGLGFYLGAYLTELLLGWGIPTTCEVASQVLTYIIGASKDYIEGVGKGTDVHILFSDGRHHSITRPERAEIEKNFATFFQATRQVIACGDTESVSDESIKFWIDLLQKSVMELRAAQVKRLNRRKSMDARVQASHQSPTADPTPEPPSSKSRGDL